MASEMNAGTEHIEDDHQQIGHVVPLKILFGVFVALLVLTYITVAATLFDLGSLNIWIALGIASIKGAMVVLYFMHLRYDSPFNSIVFLTAVAFLFLFLGITILDTIQYQPGIYEMMGQRP
jgi:cytochrome c oxidase subunit 4